MLLISTPFHTVPGAIDQYLVLPLLYHFGWMQWEELSFDWVAVSVCGGARLGATYAVCWPLEALFPIEHWEDRKTVVTDAFYTVLNRVGVLPVVSFLLFSQAPVWGKG